jgi:hypothetical protein
MVPAAVSERSASRSLLVSDLAASLAQNANDQDGASDCESARRGAEYQRPRLHVGGIFGAGCAGREREEWKVLRTRLANVA